MASPLILITQQDLENSFSPQQVRLFFSDDGSGEPGPRLGVALQVASSDGAAILGRVPKWTTPDALQALVDADASIRYHFCKLAMAVGADSKPEWWVPGESKGALLRKEALDSLRALVEGEIASPQGEAVAGKSEVKYTRTVNARQFEFARRRGQRPAGGY